MGLASPTTSLRNEYFRRMITISIDPILLNLGHFALRWYGLVITVAITVGVAVALREARHKRLSSQAFDNAIPWVVIAGLIGARLFHVYLVGVGWMVLLKPTATQGTPTRA